MVVVNNERIQQNAISFVFKKGNGKKRISWKTWKNEKKLAYRAAFVLLRQISSKIQKNHETMKAFHRITIRILFKRKPLNNIRMGSGSF